MNLTNSKKWSDYVIWLATGAVALHVAFIDVAPLLAPAPLFYRVSLWWIGPVGLIVLLTGLIARLARSGRSAPGSAPSSADAASSGPRALLAAGVILLLFGLLFGAAVAGLAGVLLLAGHSPSALKQSLHTVWGRVAIALASSLLAAGLLAALFLPVAALVQGHGIADWHDFASGAVLSLLYLGPLFAIGALVTLFPLLLVVLNKRG